MTSIVPTEITAGELAGILGVSERRVAALKAEGRIPTTEGGKILLHELLARQHAELARVRQQPHMAKRLNRAENWNDLHPADTMAGVVLRCMAGLVPGQVAKAAIEAGLGEDAIKALYQATRRQVMVAEAAAREMCGLLSDPDGPEPPDLAPEMAPLDWRQLTEHIG